MTETPLTGAADAAGPQRDGPQRDGPNDREGGSDAGPLGMPSARAYYARARGLLLTPAAEWRIIAEERPSTRQLFLLWVLPLTAFFFVAPQLGSIAFPEVINGRAVAPSVARALYTIVIGTAFMAAGVWFLAWAIDYFAKTFDAERNADQAMKLAAYSGAGLWLSGVFGLVPPLMLLGVVGLVSIYTLYRGLPVLMRAPEDKAVAYTASVIATAAVAGVVLMTLSGCLSMLGGSAVRTPTQAAAVAAVAAPAPAPAAVFDPAAPLDGEKLRRLLPDAIPGGWVRAGVTRNNGGALGFTGPTVEAVYENGGRRLVLRVIDLGVGRAAAAIASLRAIQPAYADPEGAVFHGETGGRYTFESVDRAAGVSRWLTVVGDRIAVSAEGSGGVTPAQLAEALALVDMVRVEQIAKGL
ncbi:MAG: Yip1 family protein [Hyphomonadaceae bacterium]|nr:Yip1 family protein [Hyphomonadaceae bacterium]